MRATRRSPGKISLGMPMIIEDFSSSPANLALGRSPGAPDRDVRLELRLGGDADADRVSVRVIESVAQRRSHCTRLRHLAATEGLHAVHAATAPVLRMRRPPRSTRFPYTTLR